MHWNGPSCSAFLPEPFWIQPAPCQQSISSPVVQINPSYCLIPTFRRPGSDISFVSERLITTKTYKMKTQDLTVTLQVDQKPQEVYKANNKVGEWWTKIEGKSQQVDDKFTVRFGDVYI